MRKQLFFLFVALLPLLASAQTKVEIDGIWYNLNERTQQAEITFKGINSWDYEEYSGVITIPATVTHEGILYSVVSIGDYAFSYCYNLTAIIIPDGVTSFGNYSFCDCSNLTAITIPEGVTRIGDGAFRGSSLTAITIPKGVTSIGYQTFYGCILTAITIHDGVTSIGDCAFYYCNNLISITIPNGVTRIGDAAFSDCESLIVITCEAETPPTIGGSYTFHNVNKSIPVYVPTSSVEAYKSAEYWNEFTNFIEVDFLEKCGTPSICYIDGKLILTCDTEEARIITTVTNGDDEVHEEKEFALIPTYTITAYATKENYENSDEVSLTLCWIPCTEEHKSEETGILTIPSKPVLISTQGGTITVSGLAPDTEVAAYDTAGTQLATTMATAGIATLTTNLTTGDIAIVKIGDYSIKVVIR